MLEAMSEIQFNNIEYCILLEKDINPNLTNIMKFNIPKLMPLISITNPKETLVNINKNILLNSEETKSVASGTIKTANYFKLKKSYNMRFPELMTFGDRLNCFSLTGDFREAQFSYINGDKDPGPIDNANTVDGWHIRIDNDGYMEFSQDKINWIKASGGISSENLLSQILTIDGTGSGIESDLLDGKHADAFALIGHNHDLNYLGINANAVSSSKWLIPRTLTLSGDVTGNTSIDGSADIALNVTISDNSHNHNIETITGLQTALNEKLTASLYTSSDILAKLLTVDGSGSTIDSDLMDGQHGSYYLDYNNFTNLPSLLTLGATSITAYRGDYGDIAYQHSQLAHAPSDAQKNSDITKSEIEAKLIGLVSSHTHNYISTTEKGVANGLATLDSTGKILDSQLPSIVLIDTYVCISETAQLTLDVQQGDVCVRTDINKSFIALNSNNSSMNDWQELLSPSSEVESVNGKVGAVVLTYSDVGALGESQTALTALKWLNPRTLTLNGDVTGNVSIDGSTDITLSTIITDNSHNHIWSNITDAPTSLPANGGNSDTIDGLHIRISGGILEFSADGTTFNSNNYLLLTGGTLSGSLNINGDLDVLNSIKINGTQKNSNWDTAYTHISDDNAHIRDAQFSEEVKEYSDIFSLSSITIQGTEKGRLEGTNAQNLLKNGNFANGTTGWEYFNGDIASASGTLTLTGNGTFEVPYVRTLFRTGTIKAGSKFFMKVKIRATNSDCGRLRVSIGNETVSIGLNEILTPISGQWYTIGFTATASSDVTEYIAFYILAYYADATTAKSKAVEIQEVQAYDLDAEGLTSLTDDQLNQKYSHYIDGMQSVQPCELLSRGKNLFDKTKGSFGKVCNDGTIVADTVIKNSGYIKISVNKDCYLQKVIGLERYYTSAIYDNNRKFLRTADIGSGLTGVSGKVNTGSNAAYIIINYLATDEDSVMIEESSVASVYEPYQESKAYLKEPLRSVPNGICDDVDLQTGKETKRCDEYVLQASDIIIFRTDGANVDLIQTKLITEFDNMKLGLTSTATGQLLSSFATSETVGTGWDSTTNIGKFFLDEYRINWIVTKGQYASLAAVQAALAGTKIVYQLAQEQIIDDALSNSLTVYPSGTVSLMPRKQYVLKAEDVLSVTDVTNVSLALTSNPFKNDIVYGVPTAITGRVYIESKTETYTNARDSLTEIGKWYLTESGRLDFIFAKGTTLAATQVALTGTIITYDIKPELSTIPVTVHSEPINIAAAIRSESDHNTRQDEQIRDHINSTGSDHSYIDQDVTRTATPTFAKLGIGTAVPSYPLEVKGASVLGLRATIGQSAGRYDGYGYNVGFQTTDSYKYIASDTASLLMMASGGFQFMTAPSGTAGGALTLSEKARITQGGYMGIGISNPQYTLDLYTTENYKTLRLGGSAIPLLKFANPNYNSGNGAEIYQQQNGTIYINISNSLYGINIDAVGSLSANYNISAANVIATRQTTGTDGGISLFNGTSYVTSYGLAFRTTANQGIHGYVTGDWATYFFMDNAASRGWIFKNATSGPVASIDNTGRAYMKSYRTGNFEMVYNSTENSLDFVYMG
jgi:hypothetical protein